MYHSYKLTIYLFVQTCDFDTKINRHGRTEIMEIDSIILFELFKSVCQRILMYVEPSCGLCEIEHGFAPAGYEVGIHSRVFI